uniref:Uncharacterized protein n=1 Tax=Cryptomonas curvata TaxID=233186 RepID=A0A7S0M8L9_9CRYP|mmetsp:Transcript_25959/g.53941  ORF Transcript_25959/g.53941 Transcript_25959/m.53941 type:complete len:167 (+) Transcript_25959:234-734(+)
MVHHFRNLSVCTGTAVVASAKHNPELQQDQSGIFAAGQMLNERAGTVAARQVYMAQRTQRLDAAPPPGPGGTAKELRNSINEAVSVPATPENSHYITGYSDKEVHLLVIAALLLGTATIYFAWRTQRRVGDRAGYAAQNPQPTTSSTGKPAGAQSQGQGQGQGQRR